MASATAAVAEEALPEYYRTVDPVENLLIRIAVKRRLRPGDRRRRDSQGELNTGRRTARSGVGDDAQTRASGVDIAREPSRQRERGDDRSVGEGPSTAAGVAAAGSVIDDDAAVRTFAWQEKVFSPR